MFPVSTRQCPVHKARSIHNSTGPHKTLTSTPSNTPGMNWNVDSEPNLITNHQCWTLLLLSWLDGNKTSAAWIQKTRGEAVHSSRVVSTCIFPVVMYDVWLTIWCMQPHSIFLLLHLRIKVFKNLLWLHMELHKSWNWKVDDLRSTRLVSARDYSCNILNSGWTIGSLLFIIVNGIIGLGLGLPIGIERWFGDIQV